MEFALANGHTAAIWGMPFCLSAAYNLSSFPSWGVVAFSQGLEYADEACACRLT